MSKIALKGNASGTGTFQIEAPNSNTDRTLTLPDEAGTVLTSASVLESLSIQGTLSDDTQTTPETLLTIGASYNSTGANGGAGAGARIELQVPDDETNPTTGAAIGSIKTSADDSDSSSGLAFYTSNNDTTLDEAMRIDSSGNVGLGMAPTVNNISKSISLVNGGSIFGYGSGTYITANSNYNGAWNTVATGPDSRILLDGNVIFSRSASATAGSAGAVSESMRIDSNGHVFVGATSGTPGYGNTSTGIKLEQSTIFASRSNALAASFNVNANTSLVHFRQSGNLVGSVSVTASATSYNTSSDYRLKENVVDMTGAIDRVKALPVRRFNFIADSDTTVDGFLAHEAQEIVPEAVTGTKDAVDADGNPEYQGIDQSKLVPLLTGALKEAIARIETLEAKVAALEATP